MKSTFKRILALVMVLCTVAAWMIPGVSAEEAEAPASLTVDFKTAFTNAGVPQDKYLQSYPDAMDAAYETNKFTVYRDATGAHVKPNSSYAGGRVRGGNMYLEISHNDISKYGTTAILPFKFVAPGTGDYELSFNYAKGYSGDNGGDEIGAYILAMPETPYDKYNIPSPSSDSVLIKASQATPGAAGKVTSEGTVALEEGVEYIIVFYVIDADTKAYADFVNFSLTYTEVWDTNNNADLTVTFSDAFNKAGVTDGTYLQSASIANMTNAYATNKWNLYIIDGAFVRPNALYAGGRYRAGYLEIRNNNIPTYGNTATLPSVFTAPGTGEYKLSFVYGTPSKGDNKVVELGAYILEYSVFNKYAVPAPTSSNILTKASKTNPYDANGQGSGTVTAEGTVMLEGGVEYVIVFYGISADTTDAYADFKSFSLTEAKPEASIGDTPYANLAAALAAAVSGDTIKLGADATAAQLSIPAGVTIDLNGKTLTADAVAGSVTDSADGKGVIAVAEGSAIVNTPSGTVALWDAAAGYRIFGYSLINHGVSAGEDNATAVNTEIDFYDYERNFLATEFDENGEVKIGFGDYKFKDVAGQIKADYDADLTDWRLEYSNQQYQMGRGGVCFSWGNKSIRQFGAGYMAVRFQSPAEGAVAVTLKTSSTGNEANDAGFSLYLLKASDVEALVDGDYEALVNTFVADPATAVADLNTAITTAYGAAEPVLTGISNGEAYTGSFEFEADEEYIAVFLNNGSVSGALHMNFQSISFNRAEKMGATQTFVSALTFTNPEAYAIISTGASGLKVGFKMAWNGIEKSFEYDAATIASWAKAELDNADKDYGFYIRMSGFEALGESGTLTAKAFTGNARKTAYAAGELSCTYTAE